MARLSTRPTGTVTFLFTDIEGSTRMWDEYPEAMTRALVRHDEILLSVVEAHGGIVFKHTGDGICAAFQSPGDALDAALAVQAAFRAETFESIGPMAVRVAIHTGEAEEREGDYRGPALNRVARLLDVAVGGDIVLSEAAEEIARATLPPDVELADVGEHRLRDISEPGHVFFVAMPGKERKRWAGLPWLAAVAATVLLAGAIAIFSLTSPPGTGTPETTGTTSSPAVVPADPSTSRPVGDPSPKWVIEPGGAIISLAVHDNVVLFASQSTGLHAYRAIDASPVWPAGRFVVDMDRPLIEPSGAPIVGTPVVGAGRVFYSTHMGTLHAVDLETGELLWWHRFERCLDSECTPIVASQPVMLEDAVFVTAGSDLYRFAASSGEFVRVSGGFGSATAGPTVGGNLVYLAEGPLLYQYRADDLTLQRSLFVGEDVPVGYQSGVVSLITPTMPSEFGLGSDHGVFVLDAEGFLTRRSSTSGSLHPSWVNSSGVPTRVEVATVPVVGAGLNGRVVPVLWSVNPSGYLVGIDADSGRQIASYYVGLTTRSVVLGQDGTVYIATDTPELVGYDPAEGTETFRESLVAAPGADPVEVGGVVFVAGVDGTGRAYTAGGVVELEVDNPAPGLIEGSVTSVAWSPTGDLAFVNAGHVWVVAANGVDPVNLTRLSGGGLAPAWSPDGSLLAYTSGSVGSDIYLIRPDGTGRRNLTATLSADEQDPAWSPDGSQIVFSSQACVDQGGPQTERVCSGFSELHSVDLTGRIRSLIGTPAVFASDREPDWSPTGDLIAFASDRSVAGLPMGAGWHLWTMAVDGTDLTPIPDHDMVGGRSPAFSPDGKRVAFISRGGPGGAPALYVTDLATGATTLLADLPIGAGAPAWSPDGTKLAFSWDLSTLARIYTVSLADRVAEFDQDDG